MHGRFPVAVQANFRITAYFINLKRLKKNDKIKKDCKSTRKGRRAIFFFKMRLFHLLFPKEEAIIVFASGAKQSPGRVVFRKVYTPHFLRGIATLTLAMTRKFNCLCERSEANSREGQKNTSFCQCQVSKLACKGLRTKIFIRRRHFAKMRKTIVLNALALCAL